MRPAAATVAHPAGPTSPPHTPTAASPILHRKPGPAAARSMSHSKKAARKHQGPDDIDSINRGHFSYPRGPRTEDISPRSYPSTDEEDEEDEEEEEDDDEDDDDDEADEKKEKAEEEEEEDGDDDDDDDDEEEEDDDSDTSMSPPRSPISDILYAQPPPIAEMAAAATAAAAAAAAATATSTAPHAATATATATTAAATIHVVHAMFTIEELSDVDPDESDDERVHYMQPSGYEYPESDSSLSRSRSRVREVDPVVMKKFDDMNPFDTSSEEESGDEDRAECERWSRQMREERRIRRMTSGSISKRTVSERGSDSDREDVLPYYEGPDTGAAPNYRRMRRKTDRHNMQYSGQYPERIPELKEPNSDDEIILEDAEIFARELPYWRLMDVDSE